MTLLINDLLKPIIGNEEIQNDIVFVKEMNLFIRILFFFKPYSTFQSWSEDLHWCSFKNFNNKTYVYKYKIFSEEQKSLRTLKREVEKYKL